MGLDLDIDEAFGYVVLDVVLASGVLIWQSFKVGAARKKYGVKVGKIYFHDCNLF